MPIIGSLGESRITDVDNVRSYLEHEWDAKVHIFKDFPCVWLVKTTIQPDVGGG